MTTPIIITLVVINLLLIIYSINRHIIITDLKQDIRYLNKECSILKDSFSIEQSITSDLTNTITQLKLEKDKDIAAARQDARLKSKVVTRGQVAEQFIPYQIGSLHPKDFKFLGDPIDYVVFSGVYNTRDGDVDVKEIIFLEVKTNKSKINKVQRAIRDCVKDGRVKFLVVNPDKEQLDENRSDDS